MESLRYGTILYQLSMNLSYPQGIGFVARPPFCKLIVSHIFSWTRDEVSANLFSCWLRAVTFPKRYLREFVRGSRTIRC